MHPRTFKQNLLPNHLVSRISQCIYSKNISAVGGSVVANVGGANAVVADAAMADLPKTALGQAIFAVLFDKKVASKAEYFVPGRMTYTMRTLIL